jgi:uncharacterized protein YhhL (DUF1145 family)
MELTESQRKASYAILTVLWIAIAINFVAPFGIGWLQTGLFWTGIILAISHAVEIGLFLPKLPQSVNKVQGALLIFLYGIVYASSFDQNQTDT